MDLFWVGLLGIIQGLTEFLPVSSSGHLVLAQNFIPGFSQPGVLFDVTLHLGTLLAVLIFFFKDLTKIRGKYLLYLIVGSIPAAIFGFLIKDKTDILFGSVSLVGLTLIITGFVNFLTHTAQIGSEKLGIKNTFLVGVAQAVAIIPGISRSGATIFAGVRQGIGPREAAKFSFLLSVPAILGANILEVVSLDNYKLDILPYVVGFLFAFGSGFLAIKLVIRFLEEKKFLVFSVYCLALGSLILLL